MPKCGRDMLAEPISIYFMTQLRLLPIEELRLDKSFVRDLYAALAKAGGHAYENLSLQSDPPKLSTSRTTSHGDSISSCQVGADNIVIEETETEIPLNIFVEIVQTVLEAAKQIKTDEIAPIFAQRCIFRCLVKPKSKNSISLLAGKVSNVLKAIGPFERPPQFFGVRFRFPPVKIGQEAGENGNEDVEEKHDFVSVRFETWAKDVDQVWIEVNATYFFEDPIGVDDAARIAGNIQDAHRFLTEKCINFLKQFDEMPEPEEDELDQDEEEG